MSTAQAVVFDLYGTLFDVHSVVQKCDAFYPGKGAEISALWRQKQLEYTWLRSLMGQYLPFEYVTYDALVYTCKHLKLDLDLERVMTLTDSYLSLSLHADVVDTLRRLKVMGVPMAILSNGSALTIDRVVKNAELHNYFSHLLSVDSVAAFKPDPRVYTLACQALGLSPGHILFVSSNAWDASGARHFGFETCWVNRHENTFDELSTVPSHVVSGLGEVPALICNRVGI